MSNRIRHFSIRCRWVPMVAAAVLGCVATARADLRIELDPPGDREFILDKADQLDSATEEQLRSMCDKLLTEKATPIIVVTINKMADHGGGGLRVETFARLLFDQWQIGWAKLGKQGHDWNTGILLLVSVGDRKARIELGAGWGREKDPLCSKIMNQQIVPKFKQGDFGGGIIAGVKALDAMARGKELPKVPPPPTPWWHYALVVGFIGLAIFTVISLIRRGSGGWAWLLWAAAFGIVGYMLYSMLTSSARGGSGGFGGGSFGGGFSGGGGATGSW